MKTYSITVLLVFIIFFVISFVTNILGPLIPDIIDSFDLSIGLAGFLPFSLFIAYGIMSIPAGLLIERYSNKFVLLISFGIAFGAALLFALMPTFSVALISLFSIGVSMAMLQVVINPLLRSQGGVKNFAFNSVLGQLFYGAGSFVSPLLYTYLVKNIHADNNHWLISIFNLIVSEEKSWISVYWVFAIIFLLMIAIICLFTIPNPKLTKDEKIDMRNAFRELKSDKQVILFFIGIFAYVGTEQGIANWTSKFLQMYHGMNPATTGATVLSNFWGLMTVGCVVGLLFLKLFDSRYVLVASVLFATTAFSMALFGSANTALLCFPLTGFFLSVMWSIIISLALNSVLGHHGTFSGILCSAITGGAVIPLAIGGISALVGLKFAMTIIFISLSYIFFIGFWSRPLINNSTIINYRKAK